MRSPMTDISLLMGIKAKGLYYFSVTRWLDHLFNIWQFTTTKICPLKIAKVGQKSIHISK